MSALTQPLLLAAKLRRPAVPRHAVPRPALIARLNDGLAAGRPLTLIAAPAGYGKTTLAAAWAAQVDGPVAWLALDEADDDPARFLAYCLTTLQRAQPALGQDVPSLLALPQLPPLPDLLDGLINGLAELDTPILLALDDYHVISQPAIHEALNYLVEHQPSQLHLLLLTRTDPSLPLARLRARGQMTELRAADLRFTPQEAQQFFAQSMRLALAPEAVDALETRTEGWAVGLQLAALALQNQPDPAAYIETFRGSHRYVLDYLAEEVVRQQSPETQRFLQQTAVLERFNAGLCDSVTGCADSQQRLQALEQANLFLVPLDDERRWYRYHHLFADYLRSLLTPAEQADLTRRASAWHEANGLTVEAVRYALSTGDAAFAVDVIERALQRDATWSGLNLGLFLSWLDALPAPILRDRPQLSLDAGRVLYTAGRFDQAETCIANAEQTLRAQAQTPARDDLLALAALYRGLIDSARGRFQQAIKRISAAQTQVPRENHLAHASAFFSLGHAFNGLGQTGRAVQSYLQSSEEAEQASVLFLVAHARCTAARLQITQGLLSQAEQTCQQAIAYAHSARVPQLGLAWTVLGAIALERNDLAAAERLLRDGLTLSRQAHLTDNVIWGLIFLAQLRASQGDFACALSVMQEAHASVQAYQVQRMTLLASSYLARLQLRAGQRQAARAWAQDYQAMRSETSLEHAELTLARVLLAQGDLGALPGILDPLLQQAMAASRLQSCCEALLLLGMWRQARGERQAAEESLGQALRLAAPEGAMRLFLDEGAALLDLLRNARHHAPEFVDSLLQMRAQVGGAPDAHAERLPAALSEQETRVLRLLAAGRSNQEIADELVITVGTAKWHVHNVLQKLDVSNRAQAIVRARELGLV